MNAETPLTAPLRAENLTLSYDKKIVARDLSVSIPHGELTVIIGPNACGKSTLLRTLSRLMQPQAGSVWLNGRQIREYPTKEVARQLGLLPQSSIAPGDITVFDLVARGRYPHQSLFSRWREEDQQAVEQAMRSTGVAQLADQPVDTLSGGQRQRVWIAMVLAQQTPLLLLDEPTTWLDITHQIESVGAVAPVEPGESLYAGSGAARSQPCLPLCHPSDRHARRQSGGRGRAKRHCYAGIDRGGLRVEVRDHRRSGFAYAAGGAIGEIAASKLTMKIRPSADSRWLY